MEGSHPRCALSPGSCSLVPEPAPALGATHILPPSVHTSLFISPGSDVTSSQRPVGGLTLRGCTPGGLVRARQAGVDAGPGFSGEPARHPGLPRLHSDLGRMVPRPHAGVGAPRPVAQGLLPVSFQHWVPMKQDSCAVWVEGARGRLRSLGLSRPCPQLPLRSPKTCPHPESCPYRPVRLWWKAGSGAPAHRWCLAT